jgi:hypothetical protein
MPRSTPPARDTVDRLLALSMVDRALGRLLAHPRLLQAIGVALGVLMVAFAFRPLIIPSSRPGATEAQPIASSAALDAAGLTTATAPSDEAVVLELVMAYNQASIRAAVLNTPDPMAGYLALDGAAWIEVQAEYQRRTASSETHEPALTRCGLLRLTFNGDTATVDTQEQWDDITRISGVVVASKRGTLTHNTYELRRSSDTGDWRITTVTSTTLIG